MERWTKALSLSLSTIIKNVLETFFFQFIPTVIGTSILPFYYKKNVRTEKIFSIISG